MDEEHEHIDGRCQVWLGNMTDLLTCGISFSTGEQYRLRKDCLLDVIIKVNESYPISQSDNVLAPTSPAQFGSDGFYFFTKALDIGDSSDEDNDTRRVIPFPVGRLVIDPEFGRSYNYLFLQRIEVDKGKHKGRQFAIEGPDIVDVLREYIL